MTKKSRNKCIRFLNTRFCFQDCIISYPCTNIMPNTSHFYKISGATCWPVFCYQNTPKLFVLHVRGRSDIRSNLPVGCSCSQSRKNRWAVSGHSNCQWRDHWTVSYHWWGASEKNTAVRSKVERNRAGGSGERGSYWRASPERWRDGEGRRLGQWSEQEDWGGCMNEGGFGRGRRVQVQLASRPRMRRMRLRDRFSWAC